MPTRLPGFPKRVNKCAAQTLQAATPRVIAHLIPEQILEAHQREVVRLKRCQQLLDVQGNMPSVCSIDRKA